ncbi:MAG: Stp1/IreP family PP2C-type Ser/Thr phosphatase [Acidimicrobiales bacterium]
MTARAVRLRWGGATDVGQLRSANQDSMLLGPDIFVVADGMGGHQGGEVASALAIETVSDRAVGSDVGELITAVEDANETVFERSTQDPALSGMGTTFVGIAIVEVDGEERLGIVNVGDSRAYQLSSGQLAQITDDHSLVGELVRDGRLSREDARTHPQKNIVTRAVGIDEQVQVDDFVVIPHTGDRYLLCSDGLTDEVEEGDIAVVLRTIDDPDEAAQELVRRANEHGGRDNITIVIVDVVDDGGMSDRAAASAASSVPDAEDFSDSDDDTQTFLAVPDDRAHEQRTTARREPPQDDSEPKPQRAITIRSVAFVVVVLGLLGAGAYLVNDYARNSYHVILDDDEVTIFRGRAGGVLWFDPSLEERTGIDAEDVPGTFRDRLEGGVNQSSLAAAQRYVANLEERIDELTPPVTTTTSTTSSTTAPTTTQPG